jgi:Fic family protein
VATAGVPANETQQRTRKSKANDEFALLPQEFTVDDVERVANLSYNAATKRINRWVSAAYVQLKTRSKKAIYEKKVNAIVV